MWFESDWLWVPWTDAEMPREALELYHLLRSEGSVNLVLYSAALKACQLGTHWQQAVWLFQECHRLVKLHDLRAENDAQEMQDAGHWPDIAAFNPCSAPQNRWVVFRWPSFRWCPRSWSFGRVQKMGRRLGAGGANVGGPSRSKRKMDTFVIGTKTQQQCGDDDEEEEGRRLEQSNQLNKRN